MFFFAPGGHNFDPSEKTETLSPGFLTIFRTPLSACLCDAQEPSETGGGGEGRKTAPGRCIIIGAPARRGLTKPRSYNSASMAHSGASRTF